MIVALLIVGGIALSIVSAGTAAAVYWKRGYEAGMFDAELNAYRVKPGDRYFP
ncbi:MAG: hypothetical protein ACM3UO_00130 [Bacillota bacterium]